MLAKALSSVEDLLAVRTTPRKPLLVELLLVRLPVGLRFEGLVAERAGKVLGGGGGGCGYGGEARRGGGETRRGGAVVGKGRVGRGNGGARVRHDAGDSAGRDAQV